MAHRTALKRNLSRELILHGKVETTLSKAKYVQPYVEKLVTKAKRGNDFNNVNRVNSKLRSKEALRVLFDDVAKTFSKREGGYTRIVKLGFRSGDKAPMARIEWVEVPGKKSKKKKAETVKEDAAVEDSVSEEIEKEEAKEEESKPKTKKKTKKTTKKESKEKDDSKKQEEDK